MTALTYRTTDGTKWGGGLGADLSASQIDNNFWLLYSMVVALQDHSSNNASISYFNVTGSSLYVHLTDHTVLGPYTIPTSQWNMRGDWVTATNYAALDVFRAAGALYLTIFPHTSQATFDPNANDGAGHNYYALLITTPDSYIPAGGTVKQRLGKVDGTDFNLAWQSDTRVLALYVSGKPTPNEQLLRYVSPDTITIPAGLTDTKVSSGTLPAANVIYSLAKNGAAIGYVQFNATTGALAVSFSADVTLAPGDALTITGPNAPDTTHAFFSISIVAKITG
jgi:hypothetical protein